MKIIPVHTTIGEINEPVWDVYDFPYDTIHFEWKRYKRYRYYATNIFATFDIETSTTYQRGVNGTPENVKAWMYHWQLCIDNKVIFGRTWEEFLTLIENLRRIGIDADHCIVCYVHNLPYEFQFMQNFLSWDEIFARQKRKPLRARCYEGIEFRCSYILSNMSLEKFCENEQGVIHSKNVGVYDYEKLRTPYTPMNNTEFSYCYNDVRGLYECIQSRLREDDLLSIPMTSTGYIRRQYREAMKADKKELYKAQDIKLTEDIYAMLKDAFRGGDTHANAYWVDQTLLDCESWDIQSSYPYAMMLPRFPMKTFQPVNPRALNKWAKRKDFALLMHIRLEKITYRGQTGMPYLSISKCQNISGLTADNGRVLKADVLETTVTDIDYRIIREVYKIERLYCSRLYVSKYGYLPRPIRETLLQLFTEKTTLKGVVGKEYEYMKSKNRVNGSYGMIVTDILQNEIEYAGEEWTEKEVNRAEKIEKYNRDKNRFLAYQWGVWVTAIARENLHTGSEPLGRDVIYRDTDSNKLFGSHADFYNDLNRKKKAYIDSLEIPAKVEYKGQNIYMGIWDADGQYSEFRTLGAKKYCYRDRKDGKLHVTVAGLSKKKGAEKMQHYDCIDRFTEGLIFNPSGNMSAYYEYIPPCKLTVNGDTFTSSSFLGLVPTSYILGVTREYKEIFTKIQSEY